MKLKEKIGKIVFLFVLVGTIGVKVGITAEDNSDVYSKLLGQVQLGSPAAKILKNSRFEIKIEQNGCIVGTRIGDLQKAFNELPIYLNGVKNRPWCLTKEEGCVPIGSTYKEIEKDDIQVMVVKGKFFAKEQKEIIYNEIVSLDGNSLNIHYILETPQNLDTLQGSITFILPYQEYAKGSWKSDVESGSWAQTSFQFRTVPNDLTLVPSATNDKWKIIIPRQEGFTECAFADNGNQHQEIFLNYRYEFDNLKAGDKRSLDIIIGVGTIDTNAIKTSLNSSIITLEKEKLISQETPANLIPEDTGFEAGIGGWGFMGNAWEKYVLDNNTAFEGKRSLRVIKSGLLSTNDRISLERDTEYTFSAYLKGEKPNLGIKLSMVGGSIASNNNTIVNITPTWQRYSITFKTGSKPTWCVPQIVPQGAGIYWVDAVQLEKGRLTQYKPSEPISISVNGFNKPGNIYYEKDPISLELNVYNNSDKDKDILFIYDIKDYKGELIKGDNQKIKVAPKEGFSKNIEVIIKKRGYFQITCQAREKEGIIKEKIATFCIVPEPAIPTSDDDAFFGISYINTGEPEYLKRAGIQWLAIISDWRAIENEKNNFNWSGFDKLVNVYLKNNFKLIGYIDARMPKWAASDTTKSFSPPKNTNDLSNFVYELVNRYKGQINRWDFWSECDLTTHNDSFGKTVQEQIFTFVECLKAASTAAKKADPACRFSACGVSGVDSDNNYPFAREVFKQAVNYFDDFSIHPYTWPRDFGPALETVGPEKGKLHQNLVEAINIVKQYKGNQEVWIGELGWAMDRKVAPGSDCSREYADYLVRSQIISRAVHGIKRYIWYSDVGWLADRDVDYALWYRNGRPLPAAAGYAMTSYLLTGIKNITEDCKLNLGSNILGYIFQKKEGFVSAFWSLSKKGVSVDIPVNSQEVEVFDIVGNPVKCVSKGNNYITLELTDSPLWVVLNNMSSLDKLGSTDASEKFRLFSKAIKINQPPLKMELQLTDLSKISVVLSNDINQELSGKVKLMATSTIKIANPEIEYQKLQPGKKQNVDFNVIDPQLSLMNNAEVKVIASSNLGEAITEEKLEFIPIVKTNRPIVIDGKFDDWSGIESIKLNNTSQLAPPDATAHNFWTGLDDLSAEIYLSWDNKYLYFAAKVKDDVFENNNVEKLNWNGDCIQIGVDTKNDASSMEPPGYDSNNDYAYNVALTSKGEQIYRHFAPIDKKTELCNFPVVIKRENGYTNYELAIPIEELAPLQVKKDTVFGLNFVAMDKDADGTPFSWMGLTSGIAEGKNPALFKDFVFVEK